MGMGTVETAMSYIEHVNEVTLHKLVDGAWQTEPETVRIDVMHDSSQSMFYVVAQTPSGKFPIRTYITADVTEQYVASDPQFHTWWIPDEHNNLQAWSLMFNAVEDATKLQTTIMKAAQNLLSTEGASSAPGDSRSNAVDDTAKSGSSQSLAVDFAAMKKDLTALRTDLLAAFKTDLISAKQEIMAALQKNSK